MSAVLQADPTFTRPPLLTRWRDGDHVIEVHAVSDLHVVCRYVDQPHPPELAPLVYTREQFSRQCTREI